MFNFLYYSFPWRYIIFIGVGASIAPFIANCGCGGLVIGGLISAIVGAIVGLVLALITFQLIPFLWNELCDVYRPKYQEHRAKIQKEAIDNVDNHLLK